MRSAFALRIISGKCIFNFGAAERLRAFRCSFFTGGVVMENGSCSAASCESAALWADQRFQWGRMQLPATFDPCLQEIHSGKIRRFSYIANYNGFTLSIPSTTQEHTRLLRCKIKKPSLLHFCINDGFVLERPTRLELATSTLARWRSTR